MPSSNLIKAVAVTAELCGRTFSPEAAAMFVGDLASFPEHQILAALTRCRKEVRGVLTVADVVNRIDDGRPGVEEAWSMIPKGEADTVVWTIEMAQAFFVASPILADDPVAARMAFKEKYQRLVAQARDEGRPVYWEASLGHDRDSRECVLLDAVDKGRLTAIQAKTIYPALGMPKQSALAALPNVVKMLQAPEAA